jgi:hypothetical protein
MIRIIFDDLGEKNVFKKAKEKGLKEYFTRQMIEKFDSAFGRFIYSRRMGTVEPVFATIRSTDKTCNIKHNIVSLIVRN